MSTISPRDHQFTVLDDGGYPRAGVATVSSALAEAHLSLTRPTAEGRSEIEDEPQNSASAFRRCGATCMTR
jgi:hypothetical protein